MVRIYHRRVVRQTRRALRRAIIEPEYILWNHLRNRRLGGLKFRRQYSVGHYIIDFYCAKVRLAVEIDGRSHQNTKAHLHDMQRQKYIEARGIKMLRFTNDEVTENLLPVLTEILRAARKSPHL